MKKVIIFLIVIVGFAGQSLAQNSHERKMDSLQTLLNAATEDIIRLRLYLALADECEAQDNLKFAQPALTLVDKLISQATNDKERNNLLAKKIKVFDCFAAFYDSKKDPIKRLEFLQKNLVIYKEIKDTTNLIHAIINIADYYGGIGNIPKSLEYYQNGLSLFTDMSYKKGISLFLAQIGSLYNDQGDTARALENYRKALSIAHEIKDTTNEIYSLVNFGHLYAKTNIKMAIEFYNKALLLLEARKDKGEIAHLYFFIGRAYLNTNNSDYTKSLENLQKSLSLGEELNEVWGTEGALRLIGIVYAKKGEIATALTYHNKALKLAEENNITVLIGWDCGELAADYLLQKDFKKAKSYSNRHLIISKSVDHIYNLQKAELLASKIDSACGDGISAYEHYKQYIILRDKLNSDDVKKAATKEKYKEEADKQKEEQAKLDIIALEQKKRQQFAIYAVAGVLLIVMVFSISLFRRFKVTQKQKAVIEQQKLLVEEHQQEIVDSITYAKRLQQAILPTVEAVKEHLPNSFIYYQPKDIVAGDFYWMHTTKDYTFIAAADCTGHGVPGAMVSVVCSNALNRAVNEFNLSDTGLILDKTRELVIETFEKSDSDVKDGMDISLLRIQNLNGEQKEIQWSGANNSLWYILHNELMEVKADKQPIGKYSEPTPFTTNNFSFNSHVPLYLFSDGYADQFSENDKKLMKKKFKEIVLSIQSLPMQEQGIHLENVHKDWKGTMEQTDDVLVIGIKI